MKKYIVRGDIPKDPALIIKNQLLLGPGIWNGKKFTSEQIQKGMSLTKWADIGKRSIIYGHRVDGDASPDQWLGFHTIPTYMTKEKDGVKNEGMYADLHFYDENIARKIAYGGAKAGVSERLEFRDGYEGVQIDGFLNLSVVDNPACKLAYLNLSDEGDIHTAEIMSPNYINLSEQDDSDLPKAERGSGNAKTVNMSDEKINELEAKIVALEEMIKAAAVKQEPTPEPVKEIVKEQVTAPVAPEPLKEPVAVQQPKTETIVEPTTTANKPVEITAPITDNSEVVNAIKEMSDTVSKAMTEATKVANPQSVAPTSPNQISSRDDDITNKLIMQYDALHKDE